MSKGVVLVTGGTGYIGSHTILSLHSAGYTPISIDSGINSDLAMINVIERIIDKKIIHYTIDLCDLKSIEAVFGEQKIIGVIHFAALKAVGESTIKPIEYFRNNNESLLNILECMAKYKVKNLIYSSSCTVYGNVDHSPVTESTPWQEAESPYGRTKQMGEQMINDVLKAYPLQAVLLRYFNPAGAHISGEIGEKPIVKALNLVPAIMETAIGKRDQLQVFGDDYNTRDGSCVRDYIHVMDLADAHTLALDRLVSNQQTDSVDVFNLGIGEGVTVLEAIKAFENVSGQRLKYSIAPRRLGDVVAIYADPSKAKKLLGWAPKYNINDIMKTAWTWEQKLNQMRINSPS